MRRILIVLVGMVLLAAAAALLWTAHGPRTTEERVTGGVLSTQPEIAQSAAPGLLPDLPLITDQGPSSTNVIAAEPQIAGAALSDVQAVEPGELGAAPPMLSDAPAPSDAPPVTTDVVLDDQVEVAVAPLALSAGQPPAPDGQGGAGGLTGVYEQRVVELEWPQSFRVGGSETVRIKLKMLSDGSLQPVAEIANNEVLATPILLTDRYATHTATVTATLSAPDFRVEAVGGATQPLQRGGEVEWRWTLKPENSGRSVIALGITITWTPLVGGTPFSATIWGQALQVETDYVFGALTVPQASVVGSVLAALGFIGQLPLVGAVLEITLQSLFGRRRRARRTTTYDRRTRRR